MLIEWLNTTYLKTKHSINLRNADIVYYKGQDNKR